MSFHRISESGSFTGNGSSQTVEIGWQPAFVMVGALKASGGNTSTRGFSLKLGNMPSSSTFYLRAAGVAYEASGGITITSTGFSVGSQAIHNASGVTIAWWAIRDVPGFVELGTYTGAQLIADETPQVITTAKSPARALIAMIRANTGAGQFAERCAARPAENCTVIGSVLRTRIVSPSGLFQFSGNSFTVANDGTNSAFNVSGETYYYLVVYSSEGGSDDSDTFGSTRAYHGDSRNGSSINAVVTTGLPTKQCWSSNTARNSFSFDPMPLNGWFTSGGADGHYQLRSSVTQLPERTADGYETGTFGGGAGGDDPKTNTLLFHY